MLGVLGVLGVLGTDGGGSVGSGSPWISCIGGIAVRNAVSIFCAQSDAADSCSAFCVL